MIFVRMRRLGRIFRRLVKVGVVVLVLILEGAWLWGVGWPVSVSMNRAVLRRDGWRDTSWEIAIGHGGIGVRFKQAYADALQAMRAGIWTNDPPVIHLCSAKPADLAEYFKFEPFVPRIRYEFELQPIEELTETRSDWLGITSGTKTWHERHVTRWNDVSYVQRLLIIPSWLGIIVFGVVPGVWLWRATMRLLYRLRKRKRELQGVCVGCGYDLRATPERCPECGLVVEKVEQVVEPSVASKTERELVDLEAGR